MVGSASSRDGNDGMSWAGVACSADADRARRAMAVVRVVAACDGMVAACRTVGVPIGFWGTAVRLGLLRMILVV